jgi:hypothetical protein
VVTEQKPTPTGHWERSNRSGRAGELVVGARLVELGFELFWPVNDRPSIDVITVWKDLAVNRVQIKTKNLPRDTQLSQEVRVGGTDAKKYDFLIAYLVTQTAFYVLPADQIKTKMNILFYPNGKTTKVENDYESYRDAWHLLK